MKNRSNFLLAIGLATLMMIVLQMVFPAPKPLPVENGEADVAAQDATDSLDKPEAEADVDTNNDADVAGEEPDSGSGEALKRRGIDESIEIQSSESILAQVASETADSAEINAYLNQRSLTAVRQMGDLVTIGSLYETGSDRYLITLNPYGGTVRRIELNVRDPRTGRYKYRDLLWKGGYIGSLDVYDSTSGVRVGVVGPGTPADMATSPDSDSGGIKAGDVLISLNDESITNADEFGRMMAQTHEGDDVSVILSRDGTEMVFTTTLTEKPIELIRPEPGVLDPTFVYDESFLLTLHVPSDNPRKSWTEIDADIRQSQWDVVKTDDNQVEMRFELSPELLKKHGLEGPITAVKRFGVPKLAEEEIGKFDSKTWHWDFDFEILNGSDKPQNIGYELKGPTGTPSETWWYSQKTHGRATAMFQMAGARDVLGSTTYRKFQFWGGPEIVSESHWKKTAGRRGSWWIPSSPAIILKSAK